MAGRDDAVTEEKRNAEIREDAREGGLPAPPDDARSVSRSMMPPPWPLYPRLMASQAY